MSDPVDIVFDDVALAAQLRSSGEQREALIAQAYARVFNNELGRLVLAHHLAECGVGAIRGPGLNLEQRAYMDGAADAAIKLSVFAHYDDADRAVMILTDELKGPTDDRPNDQPGPSFFFADPDFGD